MSLWKSIKKGFKKFTKFIKKIAPYLLIAAAVYFGGAYMMSLSAGASQAASVAGSFTKSAGVWKSFLGGLSTGTASSSAAAYAEASFQAASLGLPISSQAAAGTAAVNGLGANMQVGAAIKRGVAVGKEYQTVFNANPDMAKNDLLQQAMGNVPVDGAAAPLADVSVLPETVPSASQVDAYRAGEGAVTQDLKGASTQAVTSDVAETTADPAGISVDQSAVTPSTGATVELPNPGDADYLDKMIIYEQQQARLDRANQHAQTMEMYANNHRMNMYGLLFKGLGYGMNAYSQYQEGKEIEKEKERRRTWKPAGTEVNVVDTTKLKYPDGIMS